MLSSSRPDRPGAHLLGAAGELGDVRLKLGAGSDEHRLRRALAIRPLGECGGGQLELAFLPQSRPKRRSCLIIAAVPT
jgi:hypothetical protein